LSINPHNANALGNKVSTPLPSLPIFPTKIECPQCRTLLTEDDLILQRGVCEVCGYRCLPRLPAKPKPIKYYSALSGSIGYVEYTAIPMPIPLSREFLYETSQTKELKSKYLPDLREMYQFDTTPKPVNRPHPRRHQIIHFIRKITK
jgi:hypothetical protein